MSEIDALLERRFGREIPKPGLSRCVQLRNLIPQRADFNVAVVGTNGKGSFVHFFSQVCQQWGYRTLEFSSPHVHTVRERILLDGEMLPELYWQGCLEELDQLQKQICGVTYFEALWAIALMAVRDFSPDVAVWEAGLGGRLDAINALESFDLCVCTQVGIDHKELLGDTPTQIALEKLAVVRRNVPFIIGDIRACDRELLQRRVEKAKGLWVEELPDRSWVRQCLDEFVQMFDDPNAARTLVLAILYSELGSASELELNALRPPKYRLDRTRKPFCFDVSHNPDSVRRLCKNAATGSLFFGNFLERKDLQAILKVLTSHDTFTEVYVPLLPGFHSREAWEQALGDSSVSVRYVEEPQLQEATVAAGGISLNESQIVFSAYPELWIAGSFQWVEYFEKKILKIQEI